MNNLISLSKFGNAKVGENTLIINMGPATTCPSAERGLCPIAGKCYAARDERLYEARGAIMPYRQKQQAYWLGNDAEQIAFDIQEIFEGYERILAKRFEKAYKEAKAAHRKRPKREAPKKIVRWNESGDFHSMECIEKLMKIAELTPDILHYTYTHRTDLIELLEGRPKNLVVQVSVDNQKDSDKYNKLGFNTFFTDTTISIRNRKTVEGLDPHEGATKLLKAKYGKNALVCKWSCEDCGLCKVNHAKPIHICIH